MKWDVERLKRYSKEKPDFLLYDRGFYDRILLLELDYKDGRVSGRF